MSQGPAPSSATCSACGGTLASGFDDVRDPQSGESFRILRCSACGLGHTSPAPADLAPYYGEAYYGGRHGVTARYRAWQRVRFLERLAPGRGKLLDIGCGDGTFARAAAARGFHAVGTEIGGAAEISRSSGLDVRDSIEQFDADTSSFDAITMWHTLEHFRDPRAVLQQVGARLAPGGVFIVAVPDAEGLQASLFGPKWFHLDVPRHLFHFTRGSLEPLLARAGLAVEAWRHHEIEQDIFGWMQSALNSVLPSPNTLFQALTGKPRSAGAAELAASYVLGALTGPAAVAATAASTLSRRGATMVAVARPRHASSHL